MKKIPIVIFLLLLHPETFSQQNRQLINWSGLLLEFSVNKLTAVCEIENSYHLEPARPDYFTIFGNTEYSIGKIQLGIGLSYWLLYDEKQMVVPEWRPHQQVRWENKLNKFNFSARARLENRFTRDTLNKKLLNSFIFRLRPRVLFQIDHPLYESVNNKLKIRYVFSEELATLINGNNNVIAESRFYSGVWFYFGKFVSVRAGYMWVTIQDSKINNSDILYFTLKYQYHSDKNSGINFN